MLTPLCERTNEAHPYLPSSLTPLTPQLLLTSSSTASAAPVVIKHNVRDKMSPFHDESACGGAANVMSVCVFVKAEDKEGNRMSASEVYFNPSLPRTKYHLEEGYNVPRIFIGAKFRPNIRGFRDKDNDEPILSSPSMAVDHDMFTRIVKDLRPGQEEV